MAMDEKEGGVGGGGDVRSPMRRLGSTRKLLVFNSEYIETLIIFTQFVLKCFCRHLFFAGVIQILLLLLEVIDVNYS